LQKYGTLKDAQRILRHADIKTTGNVYMQAIPESVMNGPHTATLKEHTHHKDGSPGSQCVACHMPKIETQGVPGTFVSSHTFKFISPAMTDKYKIPNPCTSCHTGKSMDWATKELTTWKTASPWRVGQ
jgi:hypothetical protein